MPTSKSTGLAAYLRGKDIDELYVTGLAGDVCVYYTVLDGLEEGFSVTLVDDAVMPLDSSRFEKQLKHLQAKGARLQSTAELINHIA